MGYVYPNAGIEAARIGGSDPEMDVVAARAKLAVLAAAAPHTKTGNYARKVTVKNVPGKSRVRDRLIEATDRESLKIEYGHWWVTPMGIRVKWVKGIRIMNKAFDALKRG